METWLSFPGDPEVSNMLSAMVCVVTETAVFCFLLLILKWYVPGRSTQTTIFGRFLGALLAVFAGRIQALTFARFFYLNSRQQSLVLVIFILLDMAIVGFVYSTRAQGERNATGQH